VCIAGKKEILFFQLRYFLCCFQAWEDSANEIGPGGLTVENEVDLEVPPENFKFVNQCVVSIGTKFMNLKTLINTIAGFGNPLFNFCG